MAWPLMRPKDTPWASARSFGSTSGCSMAGARRCHSRRQTACIGLTMKAVVVSMRIQDASNRKGSGPALLTAPDRPIFSTHAGRQFGGAQRKPMHDVRAPTRTRPTDDRLRQRSPAGPTPAVELQAMSMAALEARRAICALLPSTKFLVISSFGSVNGSHRIRVNDRDKQLSCAGYERLICVCPLKPGARQRNSDYFHRAREARRAASRSASARSMTSNERLPRS